MTQTTPAVEFRKVSLAGIARKEPSSKPKTDYPVYPDATGQGAVLAARIKTRTDQRDAIDGALETDKAELKQLTSPFFFAHNSGKAEVPSSVVVTTDGGEVLVTFQNKYPMMPSEDPLASLLGAHLGRCLKQVFKIEIDSEKLPADPGPLIEDLIQLFSVHGASPALSYSEGVKPVGDFHVLRHSLFTPEVNLAINEVCPIQAMIKTKGRK